MSASSNGHVFHYMLILYLETGTKFSRVHSCHAVLKLISTQNSCTRLELNLQLLIGDMVTVDVVFCSLLH